MDERKSKAFDFASDLTRQLITLATAVIGAVLSFGDRGLAAKAGGALGWALGVYGLSAVAGGFALMALTGQLGSPKLDAASCSPYATGVRIFSGLQVVSFMGATILLAVAAAGLARAL